MNTTLNDLAQICGDGFPMPPTANNGAVFKPLGKPTPSP